ncbi:MAG: nuclear transport factor 2 family protein [Sphingomonadaceae bacterium]
MNEVDIGTIYNELSGLKKEVYLLTSLQKILDLKYKYFHLIDHFQYGRMGEVFTKDAYAVMGPYGALNGRDELVEFFDEKVFPFFDIILHGGHNPQIQMTSDTTAKGTWMYEVYELTRENPPGSVWLCGLYQDEYRIEDGEWKISKLSGSYYFNTALETPFSRERFSPYPPGAPDLPNEFRILRPAEPGK